MIPQTVTKVLQGEERALVLRILQSDWTPYSLAGATEIRVRFASNVGLPVEKRLSRSEVVLLNVALGRIQVNLTSVDTQGFSVGAQDFSVIVDFGLEAAGTYNAVNFVADLPGIEGNVKVPFDGVSTVDQVMLNWNTNNPGAIINYNSNLYGSQVLPVGTLVMSGGTSTRRKVNFPRALVVENQAV